MLHFLNIADVSRGDNVKQSPITWFITTEAQTSNAFGIYCHILERLGVLCVRDFYFEVERQGAFVLITGVRRFMVVSKYGDLSGSEVEGHFE